MREFALANARIVLSDEVVTGSVRVRDGVIAAIDTGNVRAGEDVEGDYVIPGLVELHTDHFENHYRPRPGVTWNAIAALQSHDAQVAAHAARLSGNAGRNRLDPLQNDDRFLNQALALVSEGNPSGRARGKAHAHALFDALKPDRNRGRREIQQPRGRGKRLRCTERAEQLHVFQLKH